MKYCKKCKRLVFNDTDICGCGKKLIDNPDAELPCELISVDETKCALIESTLTKAEIPYSDAAVKVQMIFGAASGQHNFYVPIGFMKKAVDALAAVNAMELPKYYDELPDKPVWEEMSPAKRNVVRVLSVLLFAAVVYICSAGVDYAAAFITGLFR